MLWRECRVLGRAEDYLAIVAREAESRPDPLAFVQELLQVDRADAQEWIGIAKERTMEEVEAAGVVTVTELRAEAAGS